MGRAKRERVRAPVAGRDESHRPRGRHERVQRLGPDKRAVGHDDDGSLAGARIAQRGGDRGGVTHSLVDEDLDAVRSNGWIGSDE